MKIEQTEKPWGYEKLWACTSDYVGKILFVKKGHRLSYQYHEKKEETILLIKGLLEIDFEKEGIREQIRLRPGENFHVPTGMKHRFIAMEDCQIIEVSTPYLDDVVRLEDEYGRI